MHSKKTILNFITSIIGISILYYYNSYYIILFNFLASVILALYFNIDFLKNIIKKIKEKIQNKKNVKELIKSKLPLITKIYKNYRMKNRVIKDYKLFEKYWIDSSENINTIGYKIILGQHVLEKAMTSKNPRPFGIKRVENIINWIKKYEKNNWKKDYAFYVGISILKEYCNFYEKMNWIDKEEYLKTKDFIIPYKKYYSIVKTGVMNINKEDFIKDAKIDYKSFCQSRHSFREFMHKELPTNIIKEAVKISQLTPTACNRQMCKIYYIKNKEKILYTSKYIHGLTQFDNDSINFIIITYDISSLCNDGEFNQGMFNCGLVACNLINALHSFEIGSCLLEFSNFLYEEIALKRYLSIPKNEKIAVAIAIGYYPKKSTIPCSSRKSIDEIFREI